MLFSEGAIGPERVESDGVEPKLLLNSIMVMGDPHTLAVVIYAASIGRHYMCTGPFVASVTCFTIACTPFMPRGRAVANIAMIGDQTLSRVRRSACLQMYFLMVSFHKRASSTCDKGRV